MAKKAETEKKTLSPSILNRKARHDYEIIETYVAGVVLEGTEVKSLREGRAQITEGYCELRDGEMWILNMHVQPYAFGNRFNTEPARPRKLLMNRYELNKLKTKVEGKGLTIIPLKLFFMHGYVKLEIAIARGKREWDRRDDIQKRDVMREQDRELNSRS
ncbi:MAG: SsrA-binding protein SmpB [Armatimonadota bacterium]